LPQLNPGFGAKGIFTPPSLKIEKWAMKNALGISFLERENAKLLTGRALDKMSRS